MLFSLTVNSEQEDTQELVSVARVLRDVWRARGPDIDTRRNLVSNIVNVCANLEGKEVEQLGLKCYFKHLTYSGTPDSSPSANISS